MDDITLDRDIRISTVGRDDYPELEGKLLTYFNGTREIPGVVIGSLFALAHLARFSRRLSKKFKKHVKDPLAHATDVD